MPRVQVYLPDDLHQFMKQHDLSPSELLQAAIRERVRRAELLVETEKYLAELYAEVGEPTAVESAAAQAWVAQILEGTPLDPSRAQAG